MTPEDRADLRERSLRMLASGERPREWMICTTIECLDALDAAEARGQCGGCTLAGPGRGDCSHFIGLPGQSIPGQHDGPDDTVDAYGKPNGWCWSCWKSHRLDVAEAIIEKLPRTADDVPVVPGVDHVFDGDPNTTLCWGGATDHPDRARLSPLAVMVEDPYSEPCVDGGIPWSQAYSTEAAARAAGKGQGHNSSHPADTRAPGSPRNGPETP